MAYKSLPAIALALSVAVSATAYAQDLTQDQLKDCGTLSSADCADLVKERDRLQDCATDRDKDQDCDGPASGPGSSGGSGKN